MPTTEPWDDLRDDMIRLVKQGMPHNFAYHPGAGGGAPLLALDKMRPFNNKRASEALTELRDKTIDESEKGKAQPALSGFIWGGAALVQAGGQWILRFTSEKKPQPVILTTFQRRLRVLNKELNGVIPADVLKSAEVVFGEQAGAVAPNLQPLRKRVDALEASIGEAGRRQADLADRADRLVQDVGGLELLLYPWPGDVDPPEPLLARTFDLSPQATTLAGEVGGLLDLIMRDLSPKCEAAEALLDEKDPAKLSGVVRAVTQALDGLDKPVAALDGALAKVTSQLGKATSTYNALKAEILAARKALGAEVSEPEPAVPLPRDWPQLRKSWDSAIQSIDAQIALLQRSLRDSDDEELKQIAEVGLNAITGNHKVRLMAAMLDVEATEGTKRAAALARLAKIARDFSDHLLSDARVAAVEQNPFDVPVPVVDTLGEPLFKLGELAA